MTHEQALSGKEGFFGERTRGPELDLDAGYSWSRFWAQGPGWVGLGLCHMSFASQTLEVLRNQVAGVPSGQFW